MRHTLTILAAAVLTAPSLSLAANPFDFSGWTQKQKTQSWSAPDETALSEPKVREDQVRPADRKPIKNYQSELFGDRGSETAPERFQRSAARTGPRTESVKESAGQGTPTAPGLADRSESVDRPEPAAPMTRSDLYRRSSQETLKQFDEFLKSRDVVNARHEEPADAQPESRIQPVTATHNPPASATQKQPVTEIPNFENFEFDYNAKPKAASPNPDFGELRKSVSTKASAVTKPDETSNPFSFTDNGPANTTDTVNRLTVTGSRLTEAIPTAPVSRFTEPNESPKSATSSEPNPFAASAVPAAQSEQSLEKKPAASDSGENSIRPASHSRFTASRTTGHASQTTTSATAAGVSADEAAVSAVLKPAGPLNLGQECPCELVVTNQGHALAEQVSVETRLPKSIRVVEANPSPVERDGVLNWQFDDLGPGEVRTIQVLIVPVEAGPVDLSAHVRYTAAQVQSLTVAEPQLEISVSGPASVSVGEPASQTVTVHNPGTGVATNIKLEAQVPAGLEHVRGERLLMDIGSLNPGETRRIRLALAAVAGGSQILQVQAHADAGLVQQASVEVHVAAPSLKASIEGPGLRYLGREATYLLRVENDGAAATDTVQMMHHIPEGFDFVRADRAAKFDEASRMLTWFVGRLGPEQSQELNVTLLATNAGEFVQAVRASSEHGSFTDAQTSTRVEGVASLVLEVADLDDPVEVGTETAYEVTITNEGTASSSQVSLACELPAGLTFLEASGPSEHRAEEKGLLFRPIAELGAGKSLTYRIHVRGDATGDKRFRCRLTSADLSQPLFTEEFTKFYGE